MKNSSAGVLFSIPYEIAVVRPLRQTTLQEREEALKAAYYNTEMLPQEMVYVDLKTDSGVSSLSTAQLSKLTGAGPLESGMEMAPEGSQSFVTLAEKFQKIFGFPYMVPVAQGRAAERIWAKLHLKEGSVVAGNMLFPSTRFHIESNGGKVVDVIGEAAHDLYSSELFKGDIDLKKLAAVFAEHGPQVGCVYVELCVNSCGGQPVSLGNLKETKAMADAHKVPLFLDACRILENSYLIKQREPGYFNRSLLEIIQETCQLADGCTMSALKDFLVPAGGFIAMRDEASYQKASLQNFLNGSQPPSLAMGAMGVALQEIFAGDSYVSSRVEQVNYLWRRLKDGIPILSPPGGHGVFIDIKSFLPHVSAENHPAEALAAFIYHMSGIRLSKGPPLAPSQTARGVELLRLAVPARRYVQGHMDDVAEAVQYAYARRREIKGLRKIEKPGRSRFGPALFTPFITMEPPQNPPHTDRHLGAIFFRRVAELGDRPFIRLQRGERFEEISWRDFGAMVQNVLLALYTLGLKAGERVAIIGENSLQWLCADLATLGGGLPNVIVSPTLSDGTLLKILGHSRCRAAFVQNAAGVGRLINLKSQLPALSHIVVMEGAESKLPDTLSFVDLVERGAPVEAGHLYKILESVHGNDLATIMYTSGSTGEPKGVMRTQDNLLSNISNGGPIVRSAPGELFIIVLSLNHLFGRFGFLKSVATGRTTAIIEATELKLNAKLLEGLAGTSLAVVPRVMERIWQSILEQDGNGELWEQLEALDLKKAALGYLKDDESRHFDQLKATLQNGVKKSLGGRMKYISYAGAAMPPRIMKFFALIGVPLIGSYGSTECGGVTLSGIGDTKPGSLGKPFPNCELRIAEDGELLVRGPTVTPGYFENPEATREAIDTEGWFHTGDLGTIDADGCLFITGRKKDVFNCSDGSNIYPGYIELLLESDPFVRQAILLGDRRPFIAALIVPEKKKIAGELDRENAALTESEIASALQSRIDRLNERLEQFEKIRKFAVIPSDFSDEVRSVTIFQKIKIDRKAVDQRYQKEIEAIYGPAADGRA